MNNLKEEKKIPKATTKRVPVYYRYLKSLEKAGVQRIKSKEFSELTQIPSATIRRDFSHFGELGRSGYGYDVPFLLEVFGNTLKATEEKKIALVGVGNLGKALINNNFRRNENLKIVCAFDNDPGMIGKKINHILIQDIKNLEKIMNELEITIAISTVPSQYSQEAINQLVNSGVTAILNFAPGRVAVPDHVRIQYIDLTTELQTLIYYDDHV